MGGSCKGGNCLGDNYLGINCPWGNFTMASCPRTQIYTNEEFKSKIAKGNEYRYINCDFINSVLSFFSMISGDR